MARIVKDYDERYAEFLDVAQQLFFTKGYDNTSIQEIIKAVGVAKGTFYHYFDSKVDILDALIKRRMDFMLAQTKHIVNDESLNALQKLDQFFGYINQWKLRSKSFLLQSAQVLFKDENVLLREKMQQEAAKLMIPMLADIITQGVEEGLFDVTYPQESAEIIFMMPKIFGETLIPLLIAGHIDADVIDHIKRQIFTYNQSVERLLGLSDETLNLFGINDLNSWLTDEQ